MTQNLDKYVGNSRRKDASNATYKMLRLFITFEWIRSHKRLFLYANSFLWIDGLSDCFIPLFDFYKLKYREISSKALIYISIDLFLDFFEWSRNISMSPFIRTGKLRSISMLQNLNLLLKILCRVVTSDFTFKM